jgi:hypothetical protein
VKAIGCKTAHVPVSRPRPTVRIVTLAIVLAFSAAATGAGLWIRFTNGTIMLVDRGSESGRGLSRTVDHLTVYITCGYSGTICVEKLRADLHFADDGALARALLHQRTPQGFPTSPLDQDFIFVRRPLRAGNGPLEPQTVHMIGTWPEGSCAFEASGSREWKLWGMWPPPPWATEEHSEMGAQITGRGLLTVGTASSAGLLAIWWLGRSRRVGRRRGFSVLQGWGRKQG